jgi:hypothetical protein
MNGLFRLIKPLYPLLLTGLPFALWAHEAGKNDTKPEIISRSSAVFIENKGQITDQYGKQRKDIDFRLFANGVNTFIGDGQMHVQWIKSLNQDVKDSRIAGIEGRTHKDLRAEVEIYRLDITLIGANKNAEIITEAKDNYVLNYFLPQCPDGVTASLYKKITYRNVYPNIDWVIYSDHESLKYDFVVHPGGSVKDIKLRYDGATSLELKDGSLIAATPFGKLEEQAPYSYTAADGKTIASSYVLNDNILTFDVAAHSGTLVIDPAVNWSYSYGTFNGASIGTMGNAVAIDKNKDGYLAGVTDDGSILNIATLFSHQEYYVGGSGDAFIEKAGAWGTFYGGSSYDVINAAAFDTAGNLYLGGLSYSGNGIVYGSPLHQSVYNGFGDAFLLKLNPSTGYPIWCTYYSGYDIDVIYGVTCDIAGNVYAAGYARSVNAMITTGAFRTTAGDGFIAKFTPAGARVWGTYYPSMINKIACDTSGNLYVVGGATNDPANVTSGSYQPNFGGGTTDGFVAKFTSAGSRLWGSYYGGSCDDQVIAIACDVWGNVYVGGYTFSPNSIATPGAHLSTGGGCSGSTPIPFGFVACLTANGVARNWGTYLFPIPGPNPCGISSLACDPAGNVWVVIQQLANYPVAIFKKNGKLKWQGFAGFKAEACAYAHGKFCLGGYYTAGTPQVTYGRITMMDGDTAAFVYSSVDTQLCQGGTYSLPYGVTNIFRNPNTFRVQLSDANGSFASATTIGTHIINTPGTVSFTIPANKTPGAGYRVRLVGTDPIDTSFDNGKNIRISEKPVPLPYADSPVCSGNPLRLYDTSISPATGYVWKGPNGNVVGIGQNVLVNNAPSSGIVKFSIEITNYACIAGDTIDVTILPNPDTVTVVSNSPICDGDTIKIIASTATPGVYYNWLTPQGYFPNHSDTFMVPNATLADSGLYKTMAILDGCPSKLDSAKVVVNPISVPGVSIVVSPGISVLPLTLVTFTANVVNGGSAPLYQWMKNGVMIAGAINKTYQAMSGVDLADGDRISVRMTSNAICAQPAEVYDSVQMELVGVKKLQNDRFVVYPNPTEGRFVISFLKDTDDVYLEITNTAGQVMYTQQIATGTKRAEINISALPAGTYMIKLTDESGNRFVTGIVKN